MLTGLVQQVCSGFGWLGVRSADRGGGGGGGGGGVTWTDYSYLDSD